LSAEQFDTVELAAAHRFDGGVRMRAAAYQRRLEGPVTLDDGVVTLSAAGPSLTQGLELSTAMSWGRRMHFGGSMALLQAHAADDEGLGMFPAWLARLSLSVPVAGWQLGYQMHFIGDRQDADGESLGGTALSVLQLRSDRLARGLDISLSVRNLFDQCTDGDAEGAGSIDGRSVAVNAQWQF